MNIEFYTFDKKYNSTKRPTLNSGTTYDCYLKTSSSIISPTIELNLGLTVNPSAWNYAYIPSYNRYYWVSEWTFSDTSWFASLNVDVLATWRPYIGDTNMYIYRSSAEYNGNIYDTKYPTLCSKTTYHRDLSHTSWNYTNGTFVIGVYGENTGSTSMTYYAFTPTNFASFVNELFVQMVSEDSIWDSLGDGIRNAIFDISAYIKSCKWYPADYNIFGGNKTSITLGNIPINCTCKEIIYTKWNVEGGRFNTPKHPQTSSRGNYCNTKPYTRHKFVYLPFGSYELDTLALADSLNIVYEVYVDVTTGVGTLSIFSETQADFNANRKGTLIVTGTCQYGVDVPLSASKTDVGGALSGLASAGTGLFSGNIGRLFSGAVKFATDIANPNLDTIQANVGSLALLTYQDNGLYSIFYTIATEDNASYGKPLYAIRQPKNISGYIEGESNDFSCPATDGELTEIKRFIDNGFFYE